MSSGEVRSSFSTSESYEANYRPLSGLAVLCMLLGIASISAFSSYWFWIVPLFTFALSAWMTVFLDKAKDEYAGQIPARLGLALSGVFLVAAPTKFFVERWVVVAEAVEFSDKFVDQLLARNPVEAFAMTRRPIDRQAMGEKLEKVTDRFQNDLREFMTLPFYTDLAGKLDQTQVTRYPTTYYEFADGVYVVGYEYDIQVGDRLYNLKGLMYGAVARAKEWEGRQWYVNLPVFTPL
jgi:hypothetical protein